MSNFCQRVVSYLDEPYKNKLRELCDKREQKEAVILREIIKEYIDLKEKQGIKVIYHKNS